jgi:ADP-ribose pyrophosphatase
MAHPTISSETVFRGRSLAVRVDRVRLPGGREARLDVVEHAGSAVLVPVEEDGGILFVRQYRHAAGVDLLELPAGTLEPGEDPLTCAGRELREETGLGARSLDEIGGFYLAPGYSTEFMRVYLAARLFPDRLPGDEDEILSLERLPRADVRRMLALGAWNDAKTVAALALYFWRVDPTADK